MTAATHKAATIAGSSIAGVGGAHSIQSQNFLKLVQRTTDAFVGDDDSSVEDVRKTLLQVRRQYDAVHQQAEKKEAQLRRLREEIRTMDNMHGNQAEEAARLKGSCDALNDQMKDISRRIQETKTSRKVYDHMLARIQREQALLRQKMLKMEQHLSRKGNEWRQKIAECDRVHSERVREMQELEAREHDAELERRACHNAQEAMEEELKRQMDSNKGRADFETWRHEVALEAANEAFNASAGRLRKLYAIEKLAGNCLQKITFEQVQRSQQTEDGFQKIREVTGLADVMDIVHKFLNREVEHEQLRSSVKDAEVRLEALRQDFDSFKRDTEGITFDPSAAGRSGEIYKEIEASERKLHDAMEEHELCRIRLQRTTLQVEHMKRWSAKIGQLFASLEEPVRVEGHADLTPFFRKLEIAVDKFIARVSQQIADQKITRNALLQLMSKEYNEQEKLIKSDKEFLRQNCRVPATADQTAADGRPGSRQGASEDDPAGSLVEERDRCKKDSEDVARQWQIQREKSMKEADGKKRKN
eukprot:TRINITY_DN92970_c0_g1_i1.p1 TRINITY_DN92970_c0_g1~~TRINITY_DN92970_c0_g1_i1.p1  ORF type:complete len:563 (+),score=195.16 TRINITY_DN92970_c0_g1_i1:97-1689(+)